jgi:hypothetical protein
MDFQEFKTLICGFIWQLAKSVEASLLGDREVTSTFKLL